MILIPKYCRFVIPDPLPETLIPLKWSRSRREGASPWKMHFQWSLPIWRHELFFLGLKMAPKWERCCCLLICWFYVSLSCKCLSTEQFSFRNSVALNRLGILSFGKFVTFSIISWVSRTKIVAFLHEVNTKKPQIYHDRKSRL